ncbi:MAG: hypothetical protein HZB10_01145 [Candidatus Yonathbacteria bacterium]|nr:hypothetical protein [Candidatus Yonathbacteria bacterium]
MTKKRGMSRGAALLIALMISSVVLAVGAGVYNRTYKALIISSFWKQAQVAFAAADSGLECALYWDKVGSGSPSCFGATISGWTPGSAGGFSNIAVAGGCVTVTITKPSPSGATTRIESRGRNTCDATVLRSVERAVGVDY